MTDNHKDKQAISRRSFLQRSLLIGAGAAGAATMPARTLAAPPKLPEQEAKKQDGYRLSKHIADYYKSADV